MWVQFLSWEDPLESEMATQSSILAWKISMSSLEGPVVKTPHSQHRECGFNPWLEN